ncbi:DUF916 domain-containing protein [Diaminobutyricimonas sp. TR449]|uniref:DUF916 domain-containing protein n=1 Tax=Diaminobutyricimonas sp. TR449 TaxID=2708076 RepID=UPI001FB8B5FF|nr:DUF916 domain-containing protein [Diaminobutyricimonas sp. TR449]
MLTTPELSRGRAGLRATLVALAALLIAGPIVFAAPAYAEDKIGVSARPASADGAPDGRTAFSYQADPGQRLDDHFLVTNTGSTEQAFTIIGTDAFNGDDGEFGLLATDEEPKAVGQWVRFENGTNRIEFSLAPGQNRLLPFSLELPAEATPGDHVGGLVASVVTGGDQVEVDRRVGTRVYARVSGQLQPALTVSGIESSYVGDWWNPFTGTVRVNYTVQNSGNIALASNVQLGVRTWFGAAASDTKGESIPEMLPGFSRTVETEVPSVAAWGYLNPGVTLKPFVDGSDPSKYLPVAETSRDSVLIALPWTLVILIALVVAAFFFRRWRQQVDARRAEEWIKYTEDEARRKAEAERANQPVGAGVGESKT